MKISGIISAGMTEVERDALDAAVCADIPYGGWCPKSRIAEDGIIPLKYGLKEMNSFEKWDAVEANVCDSDATLILYTHNRYVNVVEDALSDDAKRIVDLADKYKRTYLLVPVNFSNFHHTLNRLAGWLAGDEDPAIYKDHPKPPPENCILNVVDSEASSANASFFASDDIKPLLLAAIWKLKCKFKLKDLPYAPISRQQAVRIAKKASGVPRRKDEQVYKPQGRYYDVNTHLCQDGCDWEAHSEIPSSCNLYRPPRTPCWYVHAPWNDGRDGQMLRSSRIMAISKYSGDLLLDCSANDEG